MKKLLYRPILAQIKRRLGKNRIIVLIGARQVGKTSLMRILEEELKAGKAEAPILFYDCERVTYREIFSDYEKAVAFLKGQGALPDEALTLFLDEFQKVPNVANTLKLFADHHPRMSLIVSGSSSLEIKSQMEESLAGRKRVIEILPLGFEELLTFSQHAEAKPYATYVQDPRWETAELYREAFEDYVIYGGLPRIATEAVYDEKKAELAEIYNSYLQRDIKSYIKEEKIVPFNKLLKLLAAQCGNLFSIEELATTVRLKRSEVEEYLDILEQTYIIFLLPPYHAKLRKELTTKKKVYFYDTGLRNVILNSFSRLDERADSGGLFENAVIAELKKNAGLTDQFYFWQTQRGTEVDLIVKREDKIVPVEIKLRISSLKKLRGLRSFCEHYKLSQAFVVTTEVPGKKAQGIEFVPACYARSFLKSN